MSTDLVPSSQVSLVDTVRALSLSLEDGEFVPSHQASGSAIFSMVCEVTPELAARWLEHHDALEQTSSKGAFLRQRPLISRVTNSYVSQMKAGAWRFQPQSVLVFSSAGYILDGQHRISAISHLPSGSSILFRVEVGWDPDVFSVVDTGTKRLASQLLQDPNRTILAGATRYIDFFTGSSPEVYQVVMSNDVVLQYIREWPELQEYSSVVRNVYTAAKLNASMHLALCAVVSRSSYSDRLPEWLHGLEFGSGLLDTSPILRLRQKTLTQHGRFNGRTRRYHAGILVNAWNHYVLDRPVSALRFSSSQPLPKLLK
jgi:hypothetical protein